MTDLSPLAQPDVTRKPRVAVLVDGDNFPHTEISRLEAQAARLGEVVIRRVYGDVKKVGGWPEAAAYQMLHCDSSSGKKNLADMHLTVAAMDLAQRGLANGFVIASDDRDFEPVTQFLTETGRVVMRLRKPVKVEVPPVRAAVAPQPAPTMTTKLSEADQALKDLLSKHPNGLSLVAIGAQMRNGTVKAQTGKKTWRAYFEVKADLYELKGQASATIVRLNQP